MKKIYDQTNPKFPRDAESITLQLDPLHLDLDDEHLVAAIDSRIQASQDYYSSMGLYERQQKIFQYLKGEQIDERVMDDYSLPYMENILFEANMRNKPIALSRLPDLQVEPGSPSEESKENAQLLTDIINSDMRKRESRQVLGLAYQHRPVFFHSIIKARWNPELGSDGDYEFVNVHPNNIVLDHTCTVPDTSKMEYVAESAELSIKQICMMFPDTKDDFLDYIKFDNPNDKRSNREKMASKLTVWEVWFHWYEEQTNPETDEMEWTRIDGVVWKYQDFILKKMKNPYWDWEGRTKYFKGEISERREATEEEVFMMMFGEGEELASQQFFYNHFNVPQKPYFVMTYFRWGDNPIDYTSEYEQVIPFQDNINAEGRQIFDMNSRTKGKFIFASQSIEADTIESMNLHDFKEAIRIDAEDVGRAFTVLQGAPATPQLYQSKSENRSIGFEMMALNATTRGSRESGDETLGARQMMREQDFGVIDDIVEETINPAAEWMADWAFQFIKLFYTKPHMRKIVGNDGDSLHAAITQDNVEDGVEVLVSASSVDKKRRVSEAMQMANMGIIDPLTFFEDIGVTNPKERARRSMMYKMAPQMYLQEYVEDKPVEEQAEQIVEGGQPSPMQPEPPAPGQPPMGGGTDPAWDMQNQAQPTGQWNVPLK